MHFTSPVKYPTELDEQAATEFRAEKRRHENALSALRPGDSDDIANEFNRHLDRVTAIMQALLGRATSLTLPVGSVVEAGTA
jgi:hypothetical protein